MHCKEDDFAKRVDCEVEKVSTTFENALDDALVVAVAARSACKCEVHQATTCN